MKFGRLDHIYISRIVVQSLSCVQLIATLWLQHTRLPCPSISPGACTKLCALSSDAIQLPHPLSLHFPVALSLSQHKGLFWWTNSSLQDWSFSFSTSPSSEYLGLISFRIDLFDILAVQRTLKSLLQHHSSKASILWC